MNHRSNLPTSQDQRIHSGRGLPDESQSSKKKPKNANKIAPESSKNVNIPPDVPSVSHLSSNACIPRPVKEGSEDLDEFLLEADISKMDISGNDLKGVDTTIQFEDEDLEWLESPIKKCIKPIHLSHSNHQTKNTSAPNSPNNTHNRYQELLTQANNKYIEEKESSPIQASTNSGILAELQDGRATSPKSNTQTLSKETLAKDDGNQPPSSTHSTFDATKETVNEANVFSLSRGSPNDAPDDLA